ncbi:hypothetical protein HY230_05895 [Candidatus Acetothermia bacterium]|nr:hypothetical protein [Candidatus Acetothermia bacterium]
MTRIVVGILLGAIIVGWLGYIFYTRWRMRFSSGEYRRCRYCGSGYRGNVTYCPKCGQVVSSWSSRR